MSRIGKAPVSVPSGVNVKMNGTVIEVTGPKGTLKRDSFGRVELKQEGAAVVVSPNLSMENASSSWGLYRTLINNMITGVTQGYRRELELHGVGYKAAMSGKDLTLNVGFSHQVTLKAPAGVVFEVDKTGKIAVLGSDKEVVGQTAASVRGVRPPEPYHGKGIRYVGETIVTKVGKSAGKK